MVDGQARTAVLAGLRVGFGEGGAVADGDHLGTRYHDVAGTDRVKAQDAAHQFAFLGIAGAALRGDRHHGGDLLAGDVVPLGRLRGAQQPHQDLRQEAQTGADGRRHPGQQVKRERDPTRDRLGMVAGHGLGGQLAERDEQGPDDCNAQHGSPGLMVPDQVADRGRAQAGEQHVDGHVADQDRAQQALRVPQEPAGQTLSWSALGQASGLRPTQAEEGGLAP